MMASGIAVDSAGNAYVTGWTWTTDFPTANPLQAAHAGGYVDAFVSEAECGGLGAGLFHLPGRERH